MYTALGAAHLQEKRHNGKIAASNSPIHWGSETGMKDQVAFKVLVFLNAIIAKIPAQTLIKQFNVINATNTDTIVGNVQEKEA